MAEGGFYGNALQAASHGGNKAIVKLLLENGEVKAEGGQYGNALQAACYGGNEAIVKLLLENGAEVKAEGGEYGNALQAASYRGNEGIVKLLIYVYFRLVSILGVSSEIFKMVGRYRQPFTTVTCLLL